MTKFDSYETKFRTLKPNDPNFILEDKFMIAPRAGFEINNRCPTAYKRILQECISAGWIIPVATVYDHELTYQRLIS